LQRKGRKPLYDVAVPSNSFRLPVADDILDATATSEELGKTAGKDEDQNKTTYVKLLGLEKSKAEASRLIAEAKQSLAKYGERATALKCLADYIVARKN